MGRRQVLLDLIGAHGDRGKWFAAAKGAGYLDIALDCARSFDAEPATLVRAARDFSSKEPRFALDVGFLALRQLLDGKGFEPDPALVRQAAEHCLAAAAQIGLHGWARQQIQQLAALPRPTGQEITQRALASWLAGTSPHSDPADKRGISAAAEMDAASSQTGNEPWRSDDDLS
jgi:hypothetical protein